MNDLIYELILESLSDYVESGELEYEEAEMISEAAYDELFNESEKRDQKLEKIYNKHHSIVSNELKNHRYDNQNESNFDYQNDRLARINKIPQGYNLAEQKRILNLRNKSNKSLAGKSASFLKSDLAEKIAANKSAKIIYNKNKNSENDDELYKINDEKQRRQRELKDAMVGKRKLNPQELPIQDRLNRLKEYKLKRNK